MTPDLGYATIYWTVSGESKDDVETVQSLLDEKSNYIRYHTYFSPKVHVLSNKLHVYKKTSS